LDVAQYRHPKEFADQGVVGGGRNSGVQVAHELAETPVFDNGIYRDALAAGRRWTT
jgi:hypothetical protein